MSADDVRATDLVRTCDDRCATGPGWFWTRTEWSKWSNELALSLPEEYDGDEAQEAIIGRAVKDMAARIAAVEATLADAAAWIAESIGYPVETKMPSRPMPDALWAALVDHVHADEAGRWHGNELDREYVESWLADEAGRDYPPVQPGGAK